MPEEEIIIPEFKPENFPLKETPLDDTVLLTKLCEGQWVIIGSRHKTHVDVLEVQAGKHPGVFINGVK